jgi:hypothetical protein
MMFPRLAWYDLSFSVRVSGREGNGSVRVHMPFLLQRCRQFVHVCAYVCPRSYTYAYNTHTHTYT